MFSDPQGVPVWLQTHSVILAGILSSMKDSMVSEGQPQDPDPGFFDNAMVVDSKMTKSVVANIFEISDKKGFETLFYIWQVCPSSLWVPHFFNLIIAMYSFFFSISKLQCTYSICVLMMTYFQSQNCVSHSYLRLVHKHCINAILRLKKVWNISNYKREQRLKVWKSMNF